MKKRILIIAISFIQVVSAQTNYGTPPEDSYPSSLDGLERVIEVQHFPKVNDPIQIKDLFYWKHSTAILSKSSEIKIIEYGAYLYYNDQWNLRKKYDLKDLDKSFKTKKQTLLQGQPYVWIDNWRVGDTLFGGWALWYFIGINENGQTVCGYENIHTTSNLLNNTK
ncbi:MAG: hypothetical protein ACWA5P_02685 [bacterium]